MMSFPGGIQFTNAGLLLSSKTLLGKQVTFTRLAVGDGELGGQSQVERTSLVHEVESVEINKLVLLSDTEVTVGGPFTNQGLATGFWWREFGLFARDPDTLQEKLYVYGNAGVLADYIPAGGGAEILEKQLDATILVSTSVSISAVINSSLVYASAQDLLDHRNDGAAHGATAAATAGKIMLRDANGRAQVSDPAAGLDVVNKQTLEAAMALAVPKATNTAGTDAYTITLSGVTTYTDGMLVLMRTAVANTGTASLNVNGLGAKPIRTFKAGVDADINTGEIPANSQVLLCYSSTAVAGAGGFVSLNIRDADLLDGQHGGYYLAASSYTAADVLAKLLTVDGSGCGLIADQVDGLHFRNTNGYLEYSADGSVWNPVGMICNKPRLAIATGDYAPNVWVTIVDITGKGRLNRAMVSSVFFSLAQLKLEITIDGGAAQIITGTVAMAWVTSGTVNECLGFDGPAEFLTSLRVRMCHYHASATDDLTGVAHYALV